MIAWPWPILGGERQQQNEELLQLSNQIFELTKAIHAMASARAPAGPDGT